MEIYICETYNRNVSSSPSSLPASLTYPKRYIHIMLLCLVLGNNVTERFIYDIPTEMYTSKRISHLREGIKEKAFLNVPAQKLKLWKVAIPTKDMNDEKLKILTNKPHGSINVKEELGGELLEAEDSIISKIDKVFAENHIHILVQLPSSATTIRERVDISRVIENLGYLPRQDGRGGTLLNNYELNVYTSEGIFLTDPDISQRFDFMSSLAKNLEQKKVILVRAPPYSGKTSLAQLLENYLINSSKQYRVIRISLLWGSSVGIKCTYDNFGEVWEKIVGIDWNRWVKQCEKIPSILIIDEAQKIYLNKTVIDESMKGTGTAVDFWEDIKFCLQGSNLNVIMFASYGYGTNSAGLSTIPSENTMGLAEIRFSYEELEAYVKDYCVSIPSENTMGLAEIRFNYEELEAYVKDYCVKNFGLSSDDHIVTQFIRHIKCTTVGHVGLVRHILHHTKNAMQSSIRNKNLDWKKIYTYLNSDVFNGSIDNCRVAPNLRILSDNQKKICEDVYLKGKIGFTDSDDNKYLIRTGILTISVIDDKRYLEFAAPLTERSFFQQYYGKETRADSSPNSLYDFIVKIFTVMSKESVEILNDSFRTGKDKTILEQIWQKEFYRIGTRVLGHDYFLSRDVGACFGSEGYIDFYIDELEWAIELLRESLDMEHKRRFDETSGEYKEIVKVANETAIIDIRSESKKIRKLEGFIHVSYSENYDAYIIECLGKETVKIEIRYP